MATKNEFRRSQGIVPYGIGSIVDFPEDSLMSAGLDAWPSELVDPQTAAQIIQATEIVDGRLQLGATIQLHAVATEAVEEVIAHGARRADFHEHDVVGRVAAIVDTAQTRGDRRGDAYCGSRIARVLR